LFHGSKIFIKIEKALLIIAKLLKTLKTCCNGFKKNVKKPSVNESLV